MNTGEYIRNLLPEGEEIESIWTGKSWILEKNARWIGGPYYRLNGHVYSHDDPGLKIELSRVARFNWYWLWMLGKRPVYRCADNVMRDATNDAMLFKATYFWVCDAGFAIWNEGKLCFTDGVREDLPMGKSEDTEFVIFLRVSETEYSLRVGSPRTGYRTILLDVAKWTCSNN